MKAFLDKDFMLETETAKTLYHYYAASMPIIDYHCHVSPRDIAESRQYENITHLWLEGDHYKWRLMRWCGITERYITGDASNWEKFRAFAAALPRAVGNPVYHWTHLELQRYFCCDTPLYPDSAEEIYNHCNEILKKGLSVREIIYKSNVEVICTTDDPADTLEWHIEIEQDKNFETKVLPTFRPDKVLHIQKSRFKEYIGELEKICSSVIRSFDDLCVALSARLDFFIEHGCKIADHSFGEIPWNTDATDIDAIFRHALSGETVARSDAEAYQTALLLFLGKEYARRGVIMQLHYGVQRNVNPTAYLKLGADTGFDCVSSSDSSNKLALLLGEMQAENLLPKTILYSLNPSDNAMLSSLAGSFQNGSCSGWVQHGSAWWFNDTKTGMLNQLISLAEGGALGSFIGMLTDSRSFLSYTRHEYFRRVLCNLVGRSVENGEYPAHLEQLGELVQDIAYNNIARYMGTDRSVTI